MSHPHQLVLNFLNENFVLFGFSHSVVYFFPPSADFGVSAQITATLAKRKSFIGTPYWLVGFALIIHAGKMNFTSVICETGELTSHILTSCAVALCEMFDKLNEKITSHSLFVSFLFILPLCLFVLPQDGSRGGRSRKKRRLQPAV